MAAVGLIRHVLWIDSSESPDDAQLAMLAAAGWHASELQGPQDIAHQAPASYDAIAFRGGSDHQATATALTELSRLGGGRPVVARVAPGDLASAALAGRCGATQVVASDDFSAASWRDLNVLAGIKPAASQAAGDAANPQQGRKLKAVFVDPASRHLLALARRVAGAEVTTLVVGPTGAGKEVLARVLHDASPRAHGPFVAFNCAALPEHLIEDLLFGHEKGAFTGAHRDHRGLFEQAQGGTLFLDEIGDMPMHLQARLLRVLQERQVTRLGGTAAIALDVRVVAATAADLRLAIAERRFREDLFYRIATFQLKLAPLASRPGDILPLAQAMLERHPAPGGGAWTISHDAADLLMLHPWPGNVRELDNVVRRCVVLADSPIVTPAHLLFDEMGIDTFAARAGWPAPHATPTTSAMATPTSAGNDPAAVVSSPDAATAATLPTAVRDNEVRIVRAALASSSTKDEAARQLGISPRTLRHKLAQWRQQGLLTA
jgi:two-component system response regulator FlrC